MLNASGLFEAWVPSKGMSIDAILFALWSFPVVSFWSRRRMLSERFADRPLMLGCALFLSFFGAAGSLRVLSHLGLALSLGALLPLMPFHPVWLMSSLSWMPVFDWFGSRFFPGGLLAAKAIMGVLPAFCLLHSIRRMERGTP
jgi:hypothetical protein